MSGAKFLRFYASDWRSGCIGLSLEEEGLYIRFCAHAWETGQRLPLDDGVAASRLVVDIRMYRRVKTSLLKKGKIHAGPDGLYNPRAEYEYNLATGQAGKNLAVGVAATRRSHDLEQPDGRDQNEGREPARPPLLIADNQPASNQCPADIRVTSDESRREVSEKSPRSLGEVCQKDQSNQFAFREVVGKEEKKVSVSRKGATATVPSAILAVALRAYNTAATEHRFARRSELDDALSRRLSRRLLTMGRGDASVGLEHFNEALSAIPHWPFLAGREQPPEGRTRFRLDLDRLLSTDSRMGDVIAKLRDLHYEHGPAQPNPDGYAPDQQKQAAEARFSAAVQAAIAEERAAQQARWGHSSAGAVNAAA